MARILSTKTDGVTLADHDGNPVPAPNIIEVTFEDASGTAHTVFAHREGPFHTAEDIVHAWEQHTLHVEPAPLPEPVPPPPPQGLVTE